MTSRSLEPVKEKSSQPERLAASAELLDGRFGKAPQTIVSQEAEMSSLSQEELLEGNMRKLTRASASDWQAESEDAQTSSGNLRTLLREVSRVSMDEIDRLIIELQTLRRKLQTDGERIERDITEHTTLSAQATQLTKIVFDGVKQLPTRA